MNSFAIALGVLAGLVQLAGYWLYNKKLSHSEINPNVITWAIWGLGSVVAVIIYKDLANDWVKEFLPTVCAIAAFATFVHMMVRGSFQRPDRLEIELLILDVMVVVYWVVSDNPFLSNVFLIIDIQISFAPILRSTWRFPETEDPKPWLVWSLAYTMLTAVVIMRWEKWWDLLLPVNYLILHLEVWWLCRKNTASAAVV